MALNEKHTPREQPSDTPEVVGPRGQEPRPTLARQNDTTLARTKGTGDSDSAFTLPHDDIGPSDELAIGSIVNEQFKVVSKLGSGGMSHVYECEDLLVGRTVAIKVLRLDLSTVPQSAARFQREAKVVSMLEHDNIVKLYGLHLTEKRQPFIVMELVKGQALSDIIDKLGTLPLPRVINLVSQICDALTAAHAQGIVHRDLKPSNIVITNPGSMDERVKVLDFGIAKIANDTSAKTTRTGDVFGSPAYMSPEQALGQAVNEQSDQYSLGCVIFELLTGRTPFWGDGFLPVMMAHVNETAPSLSDVSKKHFPAQIERAVEKMLEKKPEKRFASVKEAKQAFLGNKPFQSAESPFKFLSTRSLIIAGTLSTLLLIVWSLVHMFESKKPVESPTQMHFQAENFSTQLPVVKLTDDDIYLQGTILTNPQQPVIDMSRHTDISDLGMKAFLNARGTHKVDLTRCEHVGDAGVMYLLDLPLTWLSLHDTKLTNAGMHKLCRLSSLQTLDICDTDITDQGLTELAHLTKLLNLKMHKVPITGAGLSEIIKLKNLSSLDLSFNGIRENLAVLKALNLASLRLRETNLTDQDLEALAQMPSLKHLDLRKNIRLTNAGILKLSKLKNLRQLEINYCSGITAEGVRKLSSALPHCNISDANLALKETQSFADGFRDGQVPTDIDGLTPKD